MTNTLKLVHGTAVVGPQLDLFAAAGAGLRDQKWYPKMAEMTYGSIPPYLIETIDLLADRGSHNDLATTLQAMDEMRWLADMYRRSRVKRYPIWLYAKLDTETGERRAYVRRISGSWRSNEIAVAGEIAASDALLQVEIERHPCWESSSPQDTSLVEGLTGASFLYDYTTPAPVGDVEARIASLSIDVAAGQLDRLWMGIRSAKDSRTPTNFENIWECEVGATAGTDCSAPTTDATASPGGGGNTKRTVSFATTATWAKRLTIELQDVTAQYLDNMGRFLWLFRCKVDASTSCEVQLRWGFTDMADADFIQGPICAVDNTSWDYKHMGEIQVPPVGVQMDPPLTNIENYLGQFCIQIWARRTAGSGSLHLDCLCPIPVDEGWLIAEDIGATAVGNSMDYRQTPYDESISLTIINSIIGKIPAWHDYNFRYPPGEGRIVTVCARASSCVLTDTYSIGTYYFPRWVNLRGSE